MTGGFLLACKRRSKSMLSNAANPCVPKLIPAGRDGLLSAWRQERKQVFFPGPAVSEKCADGRNFTACPELSDAVRR